MIESYADAVVARLEDSFWGTRELALETLGKLEPATLAQHASAVVARLEDSNCVVRLKALQTLGSMEPAARAQHAYAVVDAVVDLVVGMLNANYKPARHTTLSILRALPLVVPRHIDFESHNLRERLLGRLAWYRCLLRLRVRRITLYWYALPYRPSGPGHARDVAARDRMHEE